jgi:transcriptional regulatory protein RtcR
LAGYLSPNLPTISSDESNYSWSDPRTGESETRLRDLIGGDQFAEMDAFDRVQVSHVIEVCRQCRTLSEAGRLLFSASRGRKATTNDADRLRKYLNRFGIEWSQISSPADSARSQ